MKVTASARALVLSALVFSVPATAQDAYRFFETSATPVPETAPVWPLGSGAWPRQEPEKKSMRQRRAESPLYDTLSLGLGGAVLGDFDTDLRLDSETLGKGTDIDFENILGFDGSSTVFRADAYWRFGSRSRLDLTYFDIERDGSQTLGQDLQIGDTVFPAGSGLFTTFETAVFIFAYRFSILRHPDYELAVSLGTYTMDILFEIETGGGLGLSEDASIVAPVPVFGISGGVALGKNARLTGDLDYFQLELDNFGGYLANATLNLEYNLLRNVGLGLGYNYFVIQFDYEGSEFLGELEYTYNGVLLYLRFFL